MPGIDKQSKNFSSLDLIKHAKRLFPINRSLTGEGTRETLQYFESYHSELSRLRFISGEKVFDWEVPMEWNVNDAYLQHLESGIKYADFKKLNLHLMGYSEPYDGVLDLQELKKRIYTQPNQPDVVPYVTSYYSRNWGFCLSENDKATMPTGNYKVLIDSELKKGYLELSHGVLRGSSKEEIFFSSYVCHPSMVNNELSGPIVLSALMDYIKITYDNPKKSYRFVLLSETIGSIAYLSMFGEEMRKQMICGFNLTCVGDDRAYSYIQTPYSDTLADRALDAALHGLDNTKTYSYLEGRGSDERQYCSPGFRLPVCTFCRTKFGEFPEYHTSADDFSVVTEKGLQGALDVLKNIVDAFELCQYPKMTVNCEPQLGKRNLYPNISQKTSDRHPVRDRMDVLAFCDGSNDIFEISRLSNLTLTKVLAEVRLMMKEGLLSDALEA